MIRTAHQKHAHETAQGTGKHHGPNDDPLHLDACIFSGSFAFAHHGDLIPLFAVLEVDEDQDRQYRHQKNDDGVLLPTQVGQPP